MKFIPTTLGAKSMLDYNCQELTGESKDLGIVF